ncbi:hypothetical protein ORI89_13155 [Sphingobacterium sp. UT-1RO-CII-1]|uniref:MauE/DoxX family redox-associated membrane protein n=1 Tax=Sphingobacterium sp. UT-1RO-CII-1 TaxID=2995225 RepID=UPI00227D0A82|nr:MauE/DoxX family redox-associated membrane protein [Sphingobacterium sp. UT-1RO-CII-1]MCY4780602.1 hypothetical protein [Sphingobacterium sp. UT-1RO-CII-1]
MNNANKHITLISIALLLLWIPVGVDKLFHFAVFKAGILRQPFSSSLGWVLIYTLPVLELATALCLVICRLRLISFALSSLLMLAFTGYIGIALLGGWGKLPCGCGSIVSRMSWGQHFWFNLFFLALSVLGYYLQRKTHRNTCCQATGNEGLVGQKTTYKI